MTKLLTRDEALAVLCNIATDTQMSGSYRVQAIRAYLTFTTDTQNTNPNTASELINALTENQQE